MFLKLEWYNMGGSTKDRIAMAMIEAAEKSGRLKPGMTIIESSSGNTAIGLAILAIKKGYRFMAVCDRHLPIGKKNRLKALGAGLIFIPPTPEGMDTVEIRIDIAKRLAAAIPNSITLDQYSNQANVDVHYHHTGAEIWNDLAGKIDACVIFCGTCGSVSGVGRFLKEKKSDIKIVAVEPVGSGIFGGEVKPYLIAGGGLSFVPSILNESVVDRVVRVTDEEAFGAARRLAQEEGLMIGSSGGGVVHVTKKIAEELGGECRVVGILPDSGDRYIDSLYCDDWMASHGLGGVIDRPRFEDVKVYVNNEQCEVDNG